MVPNFLLESIGFMLAMIEVYRPETSGEFEGWLYRSKIKAEMKAAAISAVFRSWPYRFGIFALVTMSLIGFYEIADNYSATGVYPVWSRVALSTAAILWLGVVAYRLSAEIIRLALQGFGKLTGKLNRTTHGNALGTIGFVLAGAGWLSELFGMIAGLFG